MSNLAYSNNEYKNRSLSTLGGQASVFVQEDVYQDTDQDSEKKTTHHWRQRSGESFEALYSSYYYRKKLSSMGLLLHHTILPSQGLDWSSCTDDVSIHHINSNISNNLPVEMTGVRYALSQKLVNRLVELVNLPIGWDGYYGKPVSKEIAAFSASLLERICRDDVPEAQLVPGSDGSLRIEWHVNQYDLEIDVISPGYVIAALFDHQNGKEEEKEFRGDCMDLGKWVNCLSQNRNST